MAALVCVFVMLEQVFFLDLVDQVFVKLLFYNAGSLSHNSTLSFTIFGVHQ